MQKNKSVYNVQPLKTVEEIEDMKWSLRRHCSERDYFLFVLGINTGLRISDMLSLKVKDVRNVDKIVLKETKTSKKREVELFPYLIDEINSYTKGMSDEDYLFPSRKGDKAITTTQAYRQLVKAGKMVDRHDIGTHTLRKTFGYHFYRRTKDIATLQTMFNHANQSVTLKYIGILQDDIKDSMIKFAGL